MKEINKYLGVISIVVLFIGVTFKKMHWAGAGVLLTLGAIALIAFFIIYLFKGIKPLSTDIEKACGYAGGITMCLILLGFLFKIQHWPGAGVLILVSMCTLLVTSILLVIDSIKETDSNKQSIKTLFAFILIVLVVILYMLSPVLSSIVKIA